MVRLKAKAVASAAGRACASQFALPISKKEEDQLVLEFRKGLQKKGVGVERKPASAPKSNTALKRKPAAASVIKARSKANLTDGVSMVYLCTRRYKMKIHEERSVGFGFEGWSLDVLGVFSGKVPAENCLRSERSATLSTKPLSGDCHHVSAGEWVCVVTLEISSTSDEEMGGILDEHSGIVLGIFAGPGRKANANKFMKEDLRGIVIGTCVVNDDDWDDMKESIEMKRGLARLDYVSEDPAIFVRILAQVKEYRVK